MDDPTKILIPRSAVEYICRKETVSTNPDDFTHSEMFIRYLEHDAISSFGRWQWANGFNTALVAVKCGLDKIPTIEPERKTEKALRLLVEWAVECGFGYDNIPEEYEKHKDEIQGMGYVDGLIYIAEMEVEHE